MKARDELELRVSYDDLCQLNTGPYLENVLPVTGPEVKGTRVKGLAPGTWITAEEAMRAWKKI